MEQHHLPHGNCFIRWFSSRSIAFALQSLSLGLGEISWLSGSHRPFVWQHGKPMIIKKGEWRHPIVLTLILC